MEDFDVTNFFFENDYVLFDTSTYPLIYLKFKTENPDREQFDEYMDCMNKVFLEDIYFVVLIELDGSEYLKAEFRREIAEWHIENHDHLKEHCKGEAYISHSQEQRTLMNAILTSYPLPNPVVVTDTLKKAMNWLEGRV